LKTRRRYSWATNPYNPAITETASDPRPDPPTATEASAADGDRALVAALRARDESAFLALVEELHPAMLRVAGIYAGEEAAAEVAQDTWLAVIRGLGQFAFRASLRTWIFSILVRRARTAARRRQRQILEMQPMEDESPACEGPSPEATLVEGERLQATSRAISRLPTAQRAVLTLREVHGWSSTDVEALLGFTPAHQRVLLHRARAKLRRLLHLAERRSERA
jgi:RNA polymerase sigma-70 factor (ECF subfamily)